MIHVHKNHEKKKEKTKSLPTFLYLPNDENQGRVILVQTEIFFGVA